MRDLEVANRETVTAVVPPHPGPIDESADQAGQSPGWRSQRITRRLHLIDWLRPVAGEDEWRRQN